MKRVHRNWLSLGFVLALVVGWSLALLGFMGSDLTVVSANSYTVTKFTDSDDGTCNADCSLREAINAANTHSGPDVITLGSGNYTLSIQGTGEDSGSTGDLDITEALTITGLGSDLTVIDASGLITDRVLHIHGTAATVVISGVTLANGYIEGSSSDNSGGGINNQGASLTIANSVITGCESTHFIQAVYARGGGLYHKSGNLVLSNTVFAHNKAIDGGGIHVNSGNVVLNNTIIEDNESRTYGGGISINSGEMVFDTGEFRHNDSKQGGGIFIKSGVLLLDGGDVLSNTARNGGGVYAASNVVFTQTANSIIAHNVLNGVGAQHGGGVHINNATFAFENAAIFSNTAAVYGGGVYLNGGLVKLNSGRLSTNTAQSGGGIYIQDGHVILSKTEILYNVSNGQQSEGYGGGGVYVNGATATLTQTEVSTIAFNSSIRDGGGIYVDAGTVNLQNPHIFTNTAGLQGGGVYLVDGGKITLTQGCIVYNTSDYYAVLGQEISPINAQYNWWGLNNGPSGDGPGGGDSVNDYVNYDNFLTAAPAGCPSLPPADLVITKSVSAPSLDPGMPVTYVVRFSNQGLGDATFITITDRFPISMTYPSVITQTNITTFTQETYSVGEGYRWTLNVLPPEGYGVITFTGILSDVLPAEYVVVNTANIDSATEEAQRFNNVGRAEVRVHNIRPTASGMTLPEIDEDSYRLSSFEPLVNDINGIDDLDTYQVLVAPVYGSVSIPFPHSGDFKYDPANRTMDYEDVFSYLVTDLGGLTATAEISIAVTAANDPLSVTDIVTFTDELTLLRQEVNITDPDVDDVYSCAIDSQPSYGEVSMDGSCTWVYTPTNRRQNYQDSFEVSAMDGAGHQDSGLVRIAVDAVNNSPVIQDFTSGPAITEDQRASGSMMATDPDVNDTLSFGVATAADYGSVTVDANGDWSFTPANRTADYVAEFEVGVEDLGGLEDTTWGEITVQADNDPPVAKNSSAATDESSPVSDSVDVTDPDIDDTLTYAIIALPDYGAATINSVTGIWTYVPTNRPADYVDVFTVSITDTAGFNTQAQVTVNVSADNTPPAVSDASRSLDEMMTASGTLTVTDSDIGDEFSFVVSGGPVYGSASVDISGTWYYSPANRLEDYADVFMVTVQDLAGAEAYATVSLSVTAENSAPMFDDWVVEVDEHLAFSGVLTSSFPEAGDVATLTMIIPPSYGEGVVAPDGHWTYTPTNRLADYTDAFTVSVVDSVGFTDTAQMTLLVTAGNDAPTVAGSTTLSLSEDITATGVITGNPIDLGDTVTYALGIAPAYGGGVVIDTLSGSWVYTPANRTTDYQDSFTLLAVDSGALEGSAVITVDVSADNDAPVAYDVATTTVRITPTQSILQVLELDTDDVLSYSLVVTPSYGLATINTEGRWIYTPTLLSDSVYYDSFSVLVSDSGGLTDTATLTITVLPYTGNGGYDIFLPLIVRS